MKQLLEKLLKFIDLNKILGRQPYYIIYYNEIPLLMRKNDLISSISRTYSTTRNNIYLEIPEELLSKELKRAKDKICKEKV